MALLLISNGFESENVYHKMGQAEFLTHFFTCLKKTLRERQMQSSTLISSIGTFFLKKGDKTILEMLDKDIQLIDSFVGESVVESDEPKQDQDAIFNNMLAQMQQAVKPAKRRK